MPNSVSGLGQITFLVRDYAEAITYFTEILDFALIEDTPLDETGKRWVVVAPRGQSGARMLLAKAVRPDEILRVGSQTASRVSFFLYTGNFAQDYETFTARGVKFIRGEPRSEPYGTVAVFEDLYGNLWDLIEPRNTVP